MAESQTERAEPARLRAVAGQENKANPVAEVRQVSHTYPANLGGQPVCALAPIDLALAKGEFFSVVGPSGCGKSTLLDIMAGLIQPSEGTVLFEGQALAGKVPSGIGMVFQEDSSLPWLSVWENVAFGLRRTKTAQEKIKEKVDYILDLAGLSKFATAYPAQLSGGMRQRVCIARTLVMDPELILLDEPFGALDQQTRTLMGDELLNLWRRTDATVMLITHSISEAAMLSDRVGVMSARPGRFIDIFETGWPRERDSTILSEPSFGTLSAKVWEELRVESLRALGRDAEPGVAEESHET